MNLNQRLRAAEKAADRALGKRCPDCGGPMPCHRVFIRENGRSDLDTACRTCLPEYVPVIDLGDSGVQLAF